MLYALIGILFLFADQLLKFWTVAHIELNANPGKELIPGVLNMTYIKNSGMAFGLFSKYSGLRWVLLGLLVAFTAFIVLGIIVRYLRTGFARFTGTMLLAGLLGNGIDRAIYGYVVDMFEPKLGSITWPIFNLADCLVVIFGILFCIAVITGGLGAPDRDWDDEEEEDEEEEPVRRRRRVRDEDEDEEPVRRRHRDRDEDEEPVRHKPRRPRDEAEAEHHRHRRPRDEEEPEARRRPRPARSDDEEAPVRRRPRPVRTDDGDVTEAPARRRPTQAPSTADLGKAPESETTVSTVSRPAPAKAPAAPAAESVSAPKIETPAAPKTQAAPAPKQEKDEFDLDSILAEFK